MLVRVRPALPHSPPPWSTPSVREPSPSALPLIYPGIYGPGRSALEAVQSEVNKCPLLIVR